MGLILPLGHCSQKGTRNCECRIHRVHNKVHNTVVPPGVTTWVKCPLAEYAEYAQRFIYVCKIYTNLKLYLTIFEESALGRFFHRVIESVCLSVCWPLIGPQVTWSGCPSRWHQYPLSFMMASVIWKWKYTSRNYSLFFFKDKSCNLPKIVSVCLSALVERFFVSRIRDFLIMIYSLRWKSFMAVARLFVNAVIYYPYYRKKLCFFSCLCIVVHISKCRIFCKVNIFSATLLIYWTFSIISIVTWNYDRLNFQYLSNLKCKTVK